MRAATAAVHARVLEKMPPNLFHRDPEYEQSKTYQEDYASALASMEKALRQGSHIDTYKEGFSVLVAVDSNFRLVVFKNSLPPFTLRREMQRRVNGGITVAGGSCERRVGAPSVTLSRLPSSFPRDTP